jgi:cation-transporting ATPase 13A3/4/5
MIMYGQLETINQIINAYFSITFGEWCWVFMDGIWVITLSFCLSLARPAEKLAKVRPPSSLFGAYTLGSVLGLLTIDFIFMVIALAVRLVLLPLITH